MSEKAKTAAFLIIAAVIAGWAYASRPVTVTNTPEDEVSKPLFPEFTDPLQAQSMTITRFDPERATIRKFEVANTPDGWQILTKGGYPANATSHMAEAAVSLVDLEVLRVIESSPGQHAEYEVVEPNAKSLTITSEGVGQLVTIKNDSEKTLADLIIGVADKENPSLRYVRIPGRDRIYLVNLDPTVFSTEFSDWIDKDLLEVNPFDVVSLRFRDYSVQLTPQGSVGYLPRMDATLVANLETNAWSLAQYQVPLPGEPSRLQNAQLPEGKQLNQERLNEIRDALRDVTIVDVVQKPPQLAQALKQDVDLQKLQMDDWQTLIETGFLPYTLPGDGAAKICGSNGELVFDTKDAIRYRLLFGKARLGGENNDQKQQYLFVQTELVNEMIPVPQLQEVPEIKEGEGQDVEAQAEAREQIKEANGRAMDQYHARLATAKRRILELNDKFAEWYYVVSAADIAKLQLTPEQIAVEPGQTGNAAIGTGTPQGALSPLQPGMMAPITSESPAVAPTEPSPGEASTTKKKAEAPDQENAEKSKPAEPSTEESSTPASEEPQEETEAKDDKPTESADSSSDDEGDSKE